MAGKNNGKQEEEAAAPALVVGGEEVSRVNLIRKRREIVLRSSSFPADRRCSGGFVGRADQEGMWPWWTGRRRLRSDLIWPVPPAVVAISSVGGGRPAAGWSDREIRHLVPAASREDIVAGENRANGRRWLRSALLP
jgi:hypothetical protein